MMGIFAAAAAKSFTACCWNKFTDVLRRCSGYSICAWDRCANLTRHERAPSVPAGGSRMVEIRRLGEQIGVEVTGVDVQTLDDSGFARIYRAWLDHNVMVVRDQHLTMDEFLRYSRRFGVVVPHP